MKLIDDFLSSLVNSSDVASFVEQEAPSQEGSDLLLCWGRGEGGRAHHHSTRCDKGANRGMLNSGGFC